jgi:hypothetical protein
LLIAILGTPFFLLVRICFQWIFHFYALAKNFSMILLLRLDVVVYLAA